MRRAELYLKLSNVEHVCKWHGHNGSEHAIRDYRMQASKNFFFQLGFWFQVQITHVDHSILENSFLVQKNPLGGVFRNSGFKVN